MSNRKAFTMIELIFVIVIMGIIGKFGVEFLAQAYKSFIFSTINNQLEQNSAQAVEFIANRLQYRIKDSAIARTASGATPVALGSASGDTYKVLEWVAADIDGFRGDSVPFWSGILDLDKGSAAVLESPGTDTGKINTLIGALSNGGSSINDAALFFIGANSDVKTDYGWDGNLTTINAQKGAMHPIKSATTVEQFQSSTGTNFSGIDVYEYYKLSWTANAIVYEPGTDHNGTLRFYYDYQPWKDSGDGTGEKNTDGKSSVIMENVSTFQFIAIGDIVKIQVCVKSNLVTGEEYSLCKEKTIF